MHTVGASWAMTSLTTSPAIVSLAQAAWTVPGFLFAILLMMAATAAHMLEGEKQPEQFGSLPGSMWWAVVTLTTTGYGDVVPVTAGGRIVGRHWLYGVGALSI